MVNQLTSDSLNTNVDININILGTPENVILILSPCRSGSSALLNAFAMAGFTSTFQPLKASIRRSVLGDKTPVDIEINSSTLVIKETLGPYFPEEVHYNPLKTLTDKFNVKNLALITLLRNPDDCYNSWEKSFGNKSGYSFSTDLFNQAYQVVLAAYLEARAANIPASAIKSEDIGNRDILAKALRGVNTAFHEEMINWERSSRHAPNMYGFQKPVEPEAFKVSGILDGVKNGTGLTQSHTAVNSERHEIATAKAAYATFLNHCIL